MSPHDGRIVDQWVLVEVGVPADLGWGTAVLNADGSVTRTCKDCGASVTGPSRWDGQTRVVERRPLRHEEGCRVWPSLGNNPGRS